MEHEIHQHQPFVLNNICLIGLMGSGKSTIGPLLAQRLGYSFVDLDEEISASMGRSIRDIFECLGEDKFRQEERNQLRHFCQLKRQAIACGGGVVMTPDNIECLRRQITVYLEASPATLARRVGTSEGRPLLKGAISIEQRLATILRERESHYRDCARITLHTEAKPPQVLVEELLGQLPAEIIPPAK